MDNDWDDDEDDPWGINAWERKCEANEHFLKDNPLYQTLDNQCDEAHRAIADDETAVKWMKLRNARRTMEWIHHKKYNMEEPVPDLGKGVDDDTLLRLIGEAFGISGGCSLRKHYWYEEHGGANPRSVISDSTKHPDWRVVKELKGKELVSEVRVLLGITQPVPEGQGILF